MRLARQLGEGCLRPRLSRIHPSLWQYFETMRGAPRDGNVQKQYYDFSLNSARAAQVCAEAGGRGGVVGLWMIAWNDAC